MGIAAAHALNVGLALLALGLGGHWLEWALTDEDDAAPRGSALALAAQSSCHDRAAERRYIVDQLQPS